MKICNDFGTRIGCDVRVTGFWDSVFCFAGFGFGG